jgi:putative hydrolase of the HAD superfamily
MPRETRAIIFDLDDTLYPLDRFVLSGFDAVAAHLHRLFGVDERAARIVLQQAFHSWRGSELQICLRHFALPEALAASLVQVIRTHQPMMELPEASVRALASLSGNWRIGIVTNGRRDIQERKINALKLAGRVDTIVYADDVAKPAAEPFLEAARRLDIGVRRTVFVGNDPLCDVYGAWRLGMKTIHLAGTAAVHPSAIVADASVRSLVEVPEIAERLVA